MPLYEYRCSRNHTTEKIRPVGERDEPYPCSHLENGEVCGIYSDRILSTFNFQFSQFLQELSAGTII